MSSKRRSLPPDVSVAPIIFARYQQPIPVESVFIGNLNYDIFDQGGI